MRNIRSTYLKSLPGSESTRRFRSLPKRLILVSILAILIGLPIFIILTGILPKDNIIAQVVYWVHDYVYLPIKGYTYTLFYPFSLSWWGPLATIAVVWIVAYLSMVSVTKGVHAGVLKRIVRRNKKHGFLLKTTKWFRKLGFKAILLREVTGQERKRALYQLHKTPLNVLQEKECTYLYHVTLFHIRLLIMKPLPSNPVHLLEALLAWHETYMQLMNRTIRHIDSKRLKQLTSDMAAMGEWLFPMCVNIYDEARIKETFETPVGFNSTSLIVDCIHLAALHNDHLKELILNYYTNLTPPHHFEQFGSKNKIQDIVFWRLAESMAARQNIINDSRQILSQIRKKEIDAESFVESQKTVQWRLILDNSKEIVILGRLSLSLGLNLSGLVRQSAIALNLIETLEALDFEMNCLSDEMTKAGILHPLATLPEPHDYRWCAGLVEEELKAYQKAWPLSELIEDSPIAPEDFQLIKTHIQELYQAAGPDFSFEDQGGF